MSDLGITPQNEGHVIYVKIPELNQSRREELKKVAKGISEEARISIRNIRHEVLDNAKKSGDYTEDELKKYQETVQKIVDEYNKKIDEILLAKENELKQI
jgi:ribosome recycling factor